MENFENNFEETASDKIQSDFLPYEAGNASPDIPNAPQSTPENEYVPVKKQHPFRRRAVAAALAVLVVGGSCGITSAVVNHKWAQKTFLGSAELENINRRIESIRAQNVSNVDAVPVTIGEMKTPRQVYAENAQSVVTVSCTVKATSYTGQVSQGTSSGSGFILTEDGYIVTNYHVVDGATAINVIISAENEYKATVVGHDSVNDVAVLKIEADNLPAVTLGSSDDLYIGDMVAAIGNPLGTLSATMTVGYVSGKNREVTTGSSASINMIQTDAAINAGNSGGPLFNMYGEVVGITTAKYSGTSSSGASIEGIGFAIPIDDVMSIIGDLRDFGYVTGAYLGVTVQDTDSSLSSKYGLPSGAYVYTVVEGGSADRAGVQEKDIIIGLGDYDISSVSELTRTLRKFKANDTTTITVIRAGERKTLDITLDEKPKDLDSTTPASTQETMPENGNYEDWYKYFFGDGSK